MGDELRTLLRAEIDAERPPPLSGLVDASLRDGRRLHRRRRTRMLSAAALGSCAAVLAVAVSVPWASGRPGRGPADGGAAPPVTPSTVPAQSSAAEAPADPHKPTPEAMLFLLTQHLPAGRTSGYSRTADGGTVQLTLDSARGPVLIRLTLGPIPLDFCEHDSCRAIEKNTNLDVTPNAPHCALASTVSVEHPDGADVQISSPTCGSDLAPLPFVSPVLSQAEVVAIAADSRWSFTMDPRYAQFGKAMFPHLAVVD